MKYYRITCSNDYAGCDEDFYVALEDPNEIEEYATEILYNQYSFAEPDGRMLPGASDFWDTDYEGYDEEYDEYVNNLCVDWAELTKEEYEEEKY